MRVRIRYIQEAAQQRAPGYLDSVMGAGTIDGEWLVLDDATYRDLVARYSPSIIGRAMSALQAVGRWLAAGLPLAGRDLHFERSCVCSLCWSWDARRATCLACGCTRLKLHLETESCPLGKW